MMFALPVDGPATDRHSSCVVYVSCNGPGGGTEGRERERGAPRTDKERCMKRRPKVLFHASVGWMDRGSYCFGDFSPPEISSEFSGKSLIFLRPRERGVSCCDPESCSSFSALGARACLSSSTSGCDTKKSRTTFAPRDIFQLNVV